MKYALFAENKKGYYSCLDNSWLFLDRHNKDKGVGVYKYDITRICNGYSFVWGIKQDLSPITDDMLKEFFKTINSAEHIHINTLVGGGDVMLVERMFTTVAYANIDGKLTEVGRYDSLGKSRTFLYDITCYVNTVECFTDRRDVTDLYLFSKLDESFTDDAVFDVALSSWRVGYDAVVNVFDNKIAETETGIYMMQDGRPVRYSNSCPSRIKDKLKTYKFTDKELKDFCIKNGIGTTFRCGTGTVKTTVFGNDLSFECIPVCDWLSGGITKDRIEEVHSSIEQYTERLRNIAKKAGSGNLAEISKNTVNRLLLEV